MKIGIVGLPNVGKSTLFNAILKREQALSANYPFATIEPNVGVVDIVDPRLQKLAELVEQNEKVKPPIVYATIEFVDIAGLVAGASKGEGLGNQFLANIREVDMIIQVVRDFTDPDIIREHSKDPDTDTDVINNELIIKDIESVEKRIAAVGRDPKKKKEGDILQKYLNHLNKGHFAFSLRELVDKNDYMEFIRPLFLLTDKGMIYVFNVAENDPRLKSTEDNYESNLQGAERRYKNTPVIYISAKMEFELASLSSEDQKAFLSELGIAESGLDKIARTCFKSLGRIAFFTAGAKEVRAWEINDGSTAQKAAGAIHTDFEENFIKAEVIAYEDYAKFGSKNGAREAGKLRLEGKDYIVKDGDVIEFRIGKGA